jgi:hypothetical protein
MADTADIVAAIMTRLVDIEQRLEALESVADTRQPAADTPRGRTPVGVSKLTAAQAAALRAKRQMGAPIKDLMKEFAISKATLFRYLKET